METAVNGRRLGGALSGALPIKLEHDSVQKVCKKMGVETTGHTYAGVGKLAWRRSESPSW